MGKTYPTFQYISPTIHPQLHLRDTFLSNQKRKCGINVVDCKKRTLNSSMKSDGWNGKKGLGIGVASYYILRKNIFSKKKNVCLTINNVHR